MQPFWKAELRAEDVAFHKKMRMYCIYSKREERMLGGGVEKSHGLGESLAFWIP